ncbi:MAG: SDR family oxidoreductase [Archangium sp.]|nr:SDR family oxidoreductase [Archangium sp.]
MPTSVALITGASTGLGEVFAQRFAKDGRDLVLVARNEARLNALAERLRVHKITAHVMPFDLSKPDSPQALFDAVKAKGLHVEWLVNNAGFGSNGHFLDLPLDKEVEMVDLNCTSLLKLTHLFAGPMRARKSGRILNIASTAGFQPGPYMATYYATKAFVLSLSEALAHELKPHGVTVTCSCPGPTHTEFAARSGNDKSRLFKNSVIAQPPEVVDEAYEAMMQGDVLVVHGWLNWVATQSVRFSPRAAIRAVTAALNAPPEA